ncbi:HAD family hydrolase [Gorillibacterium timonense]|uniref:HAD family hydrolase n=1 Tax=Gorillibacterium timonense TaxID=1689269 RepID=UPI00071DA678|nr:HAD family hydrolase [Gorillibacterium timonense]
MADKIEVISLDMFQTLVNINSRRELVWKPLLHDLYTAPLADRYAQSFQSHFLVHWAEAKASGRFCLLKEVYERSFAEFLQETKLPFAAQDAVELLFHGHREALFYEETASFLEKMSSRYRMCVVSDADEAMLPGFCTEYGIRMFHSEQHGSYKNDSDNRMFKEMLKHYGVRPEKVLHIGDSVSDVIGAQREGIRTCWLNRNKEIWKQEIQPDYTVESLTEVEDILSKGQAASSAG